MKVYSQRITFFNLLTYNVETDQSLYLARPQCDMNNSYRSLTKGCMKLISFFQNDLQAGWKHLMWHWYHILTQDTKCLQYCKFINLACSFFNFSIWIKPSGIQNDETDQSLYLARPQFDSHHNSLPSLYLTMKHPIHRITFFIYCIVQRQWINQEHLVKLVCFFI